MTLNRKPTKRFTDLAKTYPRDPRGKRFALLAGIVRGEKAVEDGLVLTHARAKERMARWLKG